MEVLAPDVIVRASLAPTSCATIVKISESTAFAAVAAKETERIVMFEAVLSEIPRGERDFKNVSHTFQITSGLNRSNHPTKIQR